METSEIEVTEKSVFASDLPVEAKLERARTELLDLSARNRLLNIPRSSKSAKIVEIVDEQSAEIHRLLVREQRALTFVAGRMARADQEADDQADADSDEIAELAQPEDDGVDDRGVANRHADTRLQTKLTPAGLQKRLLDLYYDARTLEEEQGVNILFLALGTMTWIDPKNPANVRSAPLILVPVSLERGNAGEKFKLRWRLEETAPNLSLEAYLEREHKLKVPPFDTGDDFDVTKYLAAMAEAVSAKAGWQVNPDDIVLGFFSFAKFLMYRDLDPANWPKEAKLSEHAIIKPLVSDGFEASETLIEEDAHLDQHITPAEMVHIVDSDSSQSLAVHEVRKGRNIVIQGPPGTGKSQTIANIIASAIADGKTVLFVAEKMAALEVVKRRLDNTGVGDACLELHSNKANKRAVLQELQRTWELGAPRGGDDKSLYARLTESRDTLNGHAERMHVPVGTAEMTPYQVVGHLARLRQAGEGPSDIDLVEPENWSKDGFRERTELIAEVAERVTDIGTPARHVWRGTDFASPLPADIMRLTGRVAAMDDALAGIVRDTGEVAAIAEEDAPERLGDLEDLHQLSARLATAPALEASALGNPEWSAAGSAVRTLIEDGRRHATLTEQLDAMFTPNAWEADVEATREALSKLEEGTPLRLFERADEGRTTLPQLLADAARLAEIAGREGPPVSLADVAELCAVTRHAADCPSKDPVAILATGWETQTERAADLADAVGALCAAREEIGSELTDTAWETDLADARTALASHGTSLLRVFSKEWRGANRLVRTVQSQVKVPLERQLALLDALARGKAARKTIDADGQFGADVFGSAWRGERSAPQPLADLVEWNRSANALGAEARRIAATCSNRDRLGTLSRQLAEARRAAADAIDDVWRDMGTARGVAFGDVDDAASADLVKVADVLARLEGANSSYLSIARQPDPSLVGRRSALAALSDAQRLRAALSSCGTWAAPLFAGAWAGAHSDWDSLEQDAEWILANLDVHGLAGRIEDRSGLAARAADLLERRKAFAEALGELLADLRADSDCPLSPMTVNTIGLDELASALRDWRAGGERLSKWTAYRARAGKAEQLGMGAFVERLHRGELDPKDAIGRFETSYFEAVHRDQVKAVPELAHFDGELHDRVVRSFGDLDRQRIRQSSVEVVRAHHRRIPSPGGGAVGPLGVLKSEIARKRGHMPIRQLVSKAAPAVQALKPVFMMSPLSVAQFLPPGLLSFDLLVMDEASQIQPVDALGAIARCRQVVVVGDPQQLPPTAFFAKMTGGQDDGDDRDGAANVADIESILGLFTARGLPMRMLRWHYRSRHQSLIAVSNKQFYENRLFIVPSPYTAQSAMGLRFHHVANGIFETGTTRTNPVEAEAVAHAIIAHAKSSPGLSLGVVAFSAPQRRAILDRLELLRRALPPEDEGFFQSHPAEPFFVKNLENVQGDERDVILISVGYGPTAPGLRPPLRFGPVGQEGGERRLNVLISRAKRRCEVFASMTDEDIEQDFASSRKGVFALKLFMHYARTGRMEMAAATGRDQESIFEEQVAAALQARGYQIHTQVGIAGFFIDLAVTDPEYGDRYLLGIECDGASYHDARSARDRDRLRQAILEDHGWTIHRIWSTDWFRRPNEQLERVVAAIEAAKAARDAGHADPSRQGGSLEIVSIDRDDVTEMGLRVIDDSARPVPAYVEALISRPGHLTCELHEAPTGALSMLAEQVVAIEGPVHIDEIITRIRDAWGVKRAGSRIQEAVERAVSVSVRQGRLVKDGWFHSLPGAQPVVRDRSSARSATLRKPETLPPAEIKAALLDVVMRNFGATEDQVVMTASRAFGLKATSAQMRAVIVEALEAAIGEGQLARRGDLIEAGPMAPAADSAPPAPTPLEALIAEGEHERLEFKQTLRWDVAQNAVNKRLEDVAIKTIAGFANRAGGTLLIGVHDDGTVTGLARDLDCLGGSLDKFRLHLTALLGKHFSHSFAASRIAVSFPRSGDLVVCRIDVQRARTEVYVTTADRNGTVAERFYVRSGNSTQELPTSQVAAYVSEHFR